MKKRSPRSPALRLAVGAGAMGALASAVAVPLLRRRLRTPAPVTVAACAAGPLAVAVLRPRTHKRDVAIFAMQMGAFTMAHELPFDDPERLRRRLKVGYPIAVDRALGWGRLPDEGLQRAPPARPGVRGRDRPPTWVHWLWFLERYLALIWILLRPPERFPRAAPQTAAVFDIGSARSFAVPTAPPWWASAESYTG